MEFRGGVSCLRSEPNAPSFQQTNHRSVRDADGFVSSRSLPASSSTWSGSRGSERRNSSPSHLPRSISLQRFEQKGPQEPANHSPAFLQVGHFTFIRDSFEPIGRLGAWPSFFKIILRFPAGNGRVSIIPGGAGDVLTLWVPSLCDNRGSRAPRRCVPSASGYPVQS